MPDTDREQGAGSDRSATAAGSPADERRRPSRPLGRTVIVIAVFVGGMILFDLMRSQFLSDPVLQPNPSPLKVPAIRFQNESGQELALSDFSGRVVLLNIWATWCPPCRDEMPSLDALQQTFGGADFEVVAIATDPTGVAAVRPFYERLGIRSLKIFVDSSSAVMPKLRIAGLPTTLLVGRDGREIGRSTGPANWSGEGARALLRRYLPSGPTSKPGG